MLLSLTCYVSSRVLEVVAPSRFSFFCQFALIFVRRHLLRTDIGLNGTANDFSLYIDLRMPANSHSQLRAAMCMVCPDCCFIDCTSHKEDRFGVAQLSGSNAAVISTLLSSLLTVEALMGKKTNIQAGHLLGPAGMKWATVDTGRRESTSGAMGKIRRSPLYAKAYSLADILRTSIYCIVSAFRNEMVNSGKTGLLQKDWIISGKPLYGSHELLLHKMRLFLDFQAN